MHEVAATRFRTTQCVSREGCFCFAGFALLLFLDNFGGVGMIGTTVAAGTIRHSVTFTICHSVARTIRHVLRRRRCLLRLVGIVPLPKEL